MIIQIHGCALYNNMINEDIKNDNIEQLYYLSKTEINKKNWKDAKYFLKKITTNFNKEIIYQDALIDLIYINWQEKNYEESLSQISDFIKLYPKNPRIDYLLYIRGIINSNIDKYIFDLKENKEPLLTNDNKKIIKSLQDFNEIIEKFPNSQYIEQSIYYIEMLNKHLSMNMLNIAKYYYNNKLFLAAINRAKEIIEQTNNDMYREEATKIIENSYYILNKEAN